MNEQIKFDPNDIGHMKFLMKEYGNSNVWFISKNENGEIVELLIFSDRIVTKTRQKNGKKMIDTYYQNGTRKRHLTK